MKLKLWLSNLNDRESTLIATGLTCFFAYLLYLTIYAPLNEALTNKSVQLLEKKNTLVWMQKKQPLLQVGQKKQEINNTKLSALIVAQLSKIVAQKFPYQLQQTSGGEIQLTFDAVPYVQILQWLWSLDNQYSIDIKQFAAEQTARPGLIKLMIRISV